MADLERCAGCGRPFNRASKPRWTFTADAKPLGLMHSGCAAKANPKRMGIDASTATLLEARFIAWTDLVDLDDPMRELAIVMSWAVHPSLEGGVLSENQQHWIERYDRDRQRDIRAAYDALVCEFQAWLARD